jgi:hypothetical protein
MCVTGNGGNRTPHPCHGSRRSQPTADRYEHYLTIGPRSQLLTAGVLFRDAWVSEVPVWERREGAGIRLRALLAAGRVGAEGLGRRRKARVWTEWYGRCFKSLDYVERGGQYPSCGVRVMGGREREVWTASRDVSWLICGGL